LHQQLVASAQPSRHPSKFQIEDDRMLCQSCTVLAGLLLDCVQHCPLLVLLTRACSLLVLWNVHANLKAAYIDLP
jgi:hypothetical protein